MILEILEILRAMIAGVISNTIATVIFVLQSLYMMYAVFVTGLATAHPVAIFLTLLLFIVMGYFSFKFLEGSGRTLVVFFILITFLFFIGVAVFGAEWFTPAAHPNVGISP